MTAMRPPQVAGIAGGVGTTVIATLIGADDAGVVQPGQTVDVLVCRSVAHQLAAVTAAAAAMTPAPVVVIVADCADKAPRPVLDRARMLEPNVSALVWCPWLPMLRSVANPAVTARDGACADPTPGWARQIRGCRDGLIAAVVDLLADTPPPGDAHAPPTPVDEAYPPAPSGPPGASPTSTDSGGTVRAIRRPPSVPVTPAAPQGPDDEWSTVTPDAPSRPAAVPPTTSDTDRLRRTS